MLCCKDVPKGGSERSTLATSMRMSGTIDARCETTDFDACKFSPKLVSGLRIASRIFVRDQLEKSFVRAMLLKHFTLGMSLLSKLR
jgi:hypothetical protein